MFKKRFKFLNKYLFFGVILLLLFTFSINVKAFDFTYQYQDNDFMTNYYGNYSFIAGSSSVNESLVIFNNDSNVFYDIDSKNAVVETIELDNVFYDHSISFRSDADNMNSFYVNYINNSFGTLSFNNSLNLVINIDSFNMFVDSDYNLNDFNYDYIFNIDMLDSVLLGSYGSTISFTLQYRDQSSKDLISNNYSFSNVFIRDSNGDFSFNVTDYIYNFIIDNINVLTNGYFNISNLNINLHNYSSSTPGQKYYYNLIVIEPVTNLSNKTSNLNTYAGTIQDTLNVDFTTWISTALNSVFNFEIVPGLSIIGIFGLFISFALIIMLIKFFSGH